MVPEWRSKRKETTENTKKIEKEETKQNEKKTSKNRILIPKSSDISPLILFAQSSDELSNNKIEKDFTKELSFRSFELYLLENSGE